MSDDLKERRSPESIRNHYLVERELAGRLRSSTREGRTELFKSLYDELFARVPDHPRLTRRDSPEESAIKVRSRLRLLEPHLGPDVTLVEFAPGDCHLAHAAAARCRKVIGVDISDQRGDAPRSPDNFELVVYDGYELGLPDACADVAFSCMFLEHLHPDDVAPHLELARRILKPGGLYVMWTPHRFAGPHDVSRHFGDELDCFHFQEWTVHALRRHLLAAGFGHIRVYRGGRHWDHAAVTALEMAAERVVGLLPGKLRKTISARLFRAVVLTAQKPG